MIRKRGGITFFAQVPNLAIVSFWNRGEAVFLAFFDLGVDDVVE